MLEGLELIHPLHLRLFHYLVQQKRHCLQYGLVRCLDLDLILSSSLGVGVVLSAEGTCNHHLSHCLFPQPPLFSLLSWSPWIPFEVGHPFCNIMTHYGCTCHTLNTVVRMLDSFGLEGVLLSFHSNRSFCLSFSLPSCGLIFREVAAVSSWSFFFCLTCHSSAENPLTHARLWTS